MYMVGLLKDMFSRLEPILFVKNNDIDKDINRTSNHINRRVAEFHIRLTF